MERIIGIDPGMDGAVVALMGTAVVIQDMPTVPTGKGSKRAIDPPGLRLLLIGLVDLSPDPVVVFVERQQSMPEQGVASTFTIGVGYGVILGVLAGLELPFEIVAPVSWKRAMLADMPKGKGSSIIQAKRLFPQAAAELSRKKDHNRADALLIAEYGRRRRGGQGSDAIRKQLADEPAPF